MDVIWIDDTSMDDIVSMDKMNRIVELRFIIKLIRQG